MSSTPAATRASAPATLPPVVRSPIGLFLVVVAILPLVALGLIALPMAVALLAALPLWLVVPWIWRRPVRGLYLVFAATLTFEVYFLNFPDSLTDRVGFFLNLNNISRSLSGITVSPFEILLASIIIMWIAGAIAQRRPLELPRGPIVAAYAVYAFVVIGAEIRGVASGGAYLTSLWELRPQAYGLVLFLLVSSLLRDRDELMKFVGILFAIVAVKAVIADYRYMFTLHGNYYGVEAIMAHEESYFYALYLVGALATVIWCRRRAILIPVIGLVPVVGLALVVNQRRAGVLALVMGIVVLIALGIRFDPARRRTLAWLAVVLCVVTAAFLVIFWDHQSGLIGELVRPFQSLVQPDSRDYLSNLYRQSEDLNLLATIKTSPLIGIGFGRPMLVIYPMADISQQYPLWNIIPHNTVLWIGMRMGAVGYAAFFGLLAMVVLQACRQATTSDNFLRATVLVGLAAIAMELVVGYLDLQLDMYRNLIFLGVLLGVIQKMPALSGARVKEPSSEATIVAKRLGAAPYTRRLAGGTLRSLP